MGLASAQLTSPTARREAADVLSCCLRWTCPWLLVPSLPSACSPLHGWTYKVAHWQLGDTLQPLLLTLGLAPRLRCDLAPKLCLE